MTAPCQSCGAEVEISAAAEERARGFKGALNARGEVGLRPREVAMCHDCYLGWRHKDEPGVSADLAVLTMAVKQYLRREDRAPPADVQRQLERSAFGGQWNELLLAWRRKREEKGSEKGGLR